MFASEYVGLLHDLFSFGKHLSLSLLYVVHMRTVTLVSRY